MSLANSGITLRDMGWTVQKLSGWTTIMLTRMTVFLGTLIGAGAGGAAIASAEVEGRSVPWQVNLQEAYSPVMERIHEFHNLLLVVQFAIVLLVMALLGYVIYRFNAKRNPVPSRNTHNTLLEVVWTAVPIVILVIIAVPSLRLLYFADKAHDYEMTLKVVGHQWYWSYEYPDHGNFTFDSIMIPDDEIDVAAGQVRLLSVDNAVVLPVNTKVQVLVVSDDVIHNWAVPSLGLKKDATPGRTNETWVEITEEGVYYGMCSELCGVNHAFMPIEIRAVSREAFEAWVEQAKEEFATVDAPSATLAVNEPAGR